MPLYEYRCKGCGERFEKLVRSVDSTTDLRCPRCGSAEAERLVSSFGVAGRGSGTAGSGSCAPSG